MRQGRAQGEGREIMRKDGRGLRVTGRWREIYRARRRSIHREQKRERYRAGGEGEPCHIKREGRENKIE